MISEGIQIVQTSQRIVTKSLLKFSRKLKIVILKEKNSGGRIKEKIKEKIKEIYKKKKEKKNKNFSLVKLLYIVVISITNVTTQCSFTRF